MAIRAWTDDPILGLIESGANARWHEISVLAWDRDRYCEAIFDGHIVKIDASRIHNRARNLGETSALPAFALAGLPHVGTIFTFGSNLAGRHGKGAALDARRHWGAKLGTGIGRTGNAYAIPTKDATLKPLPLGAIRTHVDDFIRYAKAHPRLTFKVTALGTGLAGNTHEDMAPMFGAAPRNCELPEAWVCALDRLGIKRSAA